MVMIPRLTVKNGRIERSNNQKDDADIVTSVPLGRDHF